MEHSYILVLRTLVNQADYQYFFTLFALLNLAKTICKNNTFFCYVKL